MSWCRDSRNPKSGTLERPRSLFEQTTRGSERQGGVGLVKYRGLQTGVTKQCCRVAAPRPHKLGEAHQRPRPHQHLLLRRHVTKSLSTGTK